MDSQSRNIYKNARIAAGLTQERWAEHLGVSADSVRKYESGERMPGDDVVLTMAEVSGQLILPYWHLTRKSRVAAAILPVAATSLIGSLASVINYRIYVREYPENGGQFVKVFTLVSWAFFIIVVIPGYLLSRWSFF